MTPRTPDNIWSLVTVMGGNTMPPRHPNDDDDEDTKKTTMKRTRIGTKNPRTAENPTSSLRSLALLRQLARNAVVEGNRGAAGELSHIPSIKPSASIGITLAANFDRALRLNAGAFAGRLADRDQQEADGPN